MGKALWSQSVGTGDKMLTFQTDTHRADGSPSLSVELRNKALSAIPYKHMKGAANKEKNIWRRVFIYGTQLLNKQREV